MPDLRRAAILTLLTLVVGALALAVAPFDLAAVRLAGVALLWWYAAVAGPAVAAGITIAILATEPR